MQYFVIYPLPNKVDNIRTPLSLFVSSENL